MATEEQKELVMSAATRQLHKLVGQASEYEKLNMPTLVEEYMDEHIRPLREAIDAVQLEFSSPKVKGLAR